MLFGEGLFTIAIRGGQEYKFISPCIALYLGKEILENFSEFFYGTFRLGRSGHLVFGVA